MKTILIDMYGVIIEESKGNFIPYTYNSFSRSEHDRIKKLFKEENLFSKASNGYITSFEFLSQIGFDDPVFSMKDYIENHLTIDMGFYEFADMLADKYDLVLLSNDVSDWSRYITSFYDLDKYFSYKIISADVHSRKPNINIFNIALSKINKNAPDCIFVDNSVDNLKTAQSMGMEAILFNRDNVTYLGKMVYSFKELSLLLWMPNIINL